MDSSENTSIEYLISSVKSQNKSKNPYIKTATSSQPNTD